MLILEFGSPVFKMPSAEMMIFLAVAAKSEYKDKEEFCKTAVDKQYPDNKEWADKMKESFTFKPVRQEDEAYIYLDHLDDIGPHVAAEHGEIKDLCEIFPFEWDDVFLFFESEGMYFYYNWSTTA